MAKSMRVRKIQILEIVLGLTFICGYFLTKTNIINLHLVTFLATMLLGILYFPLGFYTLKSPDYNIGYSILFGILFSMSLVAIMFSLMKLDISIILILILVVLFLMAAFIQAIVYYFLEKKEEAQILFHDKWLTTRYLVFFILMFYALFTYNFKS